VAEKTRGKGKFKFHWGIEMNEGRDFYLHTYGAVDTADHYISNCNIYQRSYKYWHAAANHGKALAVVTAYDMYREVCEGKLEPDWKEEKLLSFEDFRFKLANAMMEYCPTQQSLPGDSKMRAVVSLPVIKRKRKNSGEELPTKQDYWAHKAEGKKARLCGNLSHFAHHVHSRESFKNFKACAYCGLPTYNACGICKDAKGESIPLHWHTGKGQYPAKTCYIRYHNDLEFGNGRCDWVAAGLAKKSDWKEPTVKKQRENESLIKKYQRHHH
jgi:hypothetical protein